MTKIVVGDVAEYYDDVSHLYLDHVRFKGAYRRYLSRRELSFVIEHLKPQGKILEIGAGPGFFTRALVKHAESIMAIDVSDKMVEELKENVPAPNLSAMCLDLYDLDKLPDYGNYDSVVCMRVLAHVPDVNRALAKIRGAIHDQGNATFDILNDFSYVHFALKLLGRPLRHTKYYPVATMHEMIDQAGFEVVDSFGRGYPYIGALTLDKIGYKILPKLAYGVCFNVVPANG
jgi:2-polyprenyl-3-methyl-5-hydroxy-6-metoxy-1,4-benzoquinol methylase